jgi:RND family efflux transporter MFP subunit
MSDRYLCLLPFAFCLLLSGCQQKNAAAVKPVEAPPVEVRVVQVESKPFTSTVAVTGTLVSRTRVEVKAETIGRVLRFPKEEGDPVAAGEPVIWVDDEDSRLALRQTESAVLVAEAALERAKVLELHSKSENERAQNLLRSGGITEKDFKAAELAEQDARAQAALAQAQLDQARAAVAVARKRVEDTVVRAPVSGEIQHKSVNPGAYVEMATPVFTLVDNRRLELESSVPSADIAQLRPGQAVTFSVNSYPGERFEGRLIEILPAVDAESRSAKVRVQVSAGGRLKAGMFAQGEILTGMQREAVVIPAAAVYRDDRSAKDSYVFVVENGKAVRRAVRIGRETDSMLEITEGLKPGDALIAEQSVEVAEGVKVRAGS